MDTMTVTRASEALELDGEIRDIQMNPDSAAAWGLGYTLQHFQVSLSVCCSPIWALSGLDRLALRYISACCGSSCARLRMWSRVDRSHASNSDLNTRGQRVPHM